MTIWGKKLLLRMNHISSIENFLQTTNEYHQTNQQQHNKSKYPLDWTISCYFTTKVSITWDISNPNPGANGWTLRSNPLYVIPKL